MKKEITLDTTISELLNNYDGMKDILIDINPKFKKLNNPILRKTLAKLATVKQAAIIGGMEPIVLLNKLREATNQKPLTQDITISKKSYSPPPAWLDENSVNIILDANELLDNEKNPLSEVAKYLKEEETVAIKSDFLPEPLIDEFIKRGKRVYTKKINKDSYLTYITNID